MRCTVAGLIPCAAAIVRVLQCVAPRGLLCVVAFTRRFTFADEIDTGRPRPGASSSSAATPPATNRLRHSKTVGRVVPTSRAMRRLARPCDASKTMRARRAMRWGDVRAPTQPSNVRLASLLTVSASGDSHIVIPSVAPRRSISESVDGDLVPPELDREAARECDHATLRRAIDDDTLLVAFARLRGEVHDTAAPLLDHRRRHGPTAMHHADEVDRDQILPVGRCGL